MFTSVWTKYLPVIRIVLKRSLASEQMLALNTSDFEKTGLKRQSGYKFQIRLKEGLPAQTIVDSPVASAFVAVLRSDERTKELLADNEFQITLSPKFQLTIKHLPKYKMAAVTTEEAADSIWYFQTNSVIINYNIKVNA